MDTRATLPAETICHILGYSSPRDVTHWRTVSKWFYAITYDSEVWKAMYANSSLPRPPGPFPFQSTAYLERTLIRTERLAQSWTKGPMRELSRTELHVEQQPRGYIRLLGGRWIVGCESARRFVLHDVDGGTEPRAQPRQVILEQEELVRSWDVSSTTTEDGQFAVYVLFCEKRLDATHWRLLEFVLGGESGQLCGTAVFDVPVSEPKTDYAYLEGGTSPFLHLPSLVLIFDTRTRIFYGFPQFRVALDETRRKVGSYIRVSTIPDSLVLTSTHIISFCRRTDLHSVPATLIQVFTIPLHGPSVGNSKDVLRLSYEGYSDHSFNRYTLLRRPIVDPITRSTNVRLLEVMKVNNLDQCVFCNELTLPKHSDEDVLPITIAMDEIIGRPNELPRHTLGYPRSYAHCSEDGHLRGFFGKPCYPSPQVHPKSHSVLKLTIDATHEEHMLSLGEPLLPEWNCIEDLPYTLEIISFDNGRLCFVKSGDTEGPLQAVVVVDIE